MRTVTSPFPLLPSAFCTLATPQCDSTEYIPRHVPPLFMTLFSTSITNAIDFSGGGDPAARKSVRSRSGSREKFISIRPRLIFEMRERRREGEFFCVDGNIIKKTLSRSFEFNYLIEGMKIWGRWDKEYFYKFIS